jgi:hypothetical protein
MTAPALWRRPGFGRFWAASTVSEFGTPITTLAVQVLVVFDLQERVGRRRRRGISARGGR